MNYCPKCHAETSDNFNFCPSCGKQLKITPADTSLPKQIIIYLVSFFLPPFGLSYAYKYYLLPDAKAKKIAIISTILTVLSIISAVSITTASLSALQSGVKDQMDMYKDLGI